MGWETVVLAAITAIPPSIVAAAAFYQAKKTHEAVNSRMTELLEISRKQAADDATLREKRAEHVRKGEAAVAAVNGQKRPVDAPKPKESK